ncbi:MAG TPA: hypothetical protein VH325_02555 [Bryobacteraceae bacterium]|nr:hypothetical protein [Bryobacteraceae bacterium]
MGRIASALPVLIGGPLRFSYRPALTAYRGQLLSGRPEQGTPVHAASFIRERRIVLERELLLSRSLFRLILIHELFHFVWARLGNKLRREYSSLLTVERAQRARGELGESSNAWKVSLGEHDCHDHTLLWRNYVCESFCDTAAWLYAGLKNHESFTLAPRWRERRARWLRDTFASPRGY